MLLKHWIPETHFLLHKIRILQICSKILVLKCIVEALKCNSAVYTSKFFDLIFWIYIITILNKEFIVLNDIAEQLFLLFTHDSCRKESLTTIYNFASKMLSQGTNLNIKRRGQKSHAHIKHLFAFDNLHFLITERKIKGNCSNHFLCI